MTALLVALLTTYALLWLLAFEAGRDHERDRAERVAESLDLLAGSRDRHPTAR